MRFIHVAERREKRRLIQLSPRERDILAGLVHGRSNKEIGDALSIQPGTVKTYLCGLCGETGLNRLQLVAWVLTYPEVLAGAAVDTEFHPSGCGCGRAWCALGAVMRGGLIDNSPSFHTHPA
jgi:DNA-binding CsgD family transcriptional regulator